MMKKTAWTLCSIVMALNGYPQQPLSLKYLADSLPSETPVRLNLPTHDKFFAAGRIALSPDGNELYYGERTGYSSSSVKNLVKTSFFDNNWNEPEILYSDSCVSPALSPDGSTLFFHSNLQVYATRGLQNDTTVTQSIAKTADPIYCVQYTQSGKFYFASSVNGSNNIYDIFYMEINETDTIIKNLGISKQAKLSWDFYIARDESFILLLLEKGNNEDKYSFFGDRDLFISFRESDDTWSRPVNLGENINGACYSWKWGQYVSDDYKNLFFSSGESNETIGVYWLEFETILNEQIQNHALRKSIQSVSRKVIGDLLSRPGFMMYDTEYATAVHYAEVCTAFGAARLAGLLNDDTLVARLSDRYIKVIEDTIENTANHVDANVYGILPLELYMQDQDTVFYTQGMELANQQWENPLPNDLTSQTRFWIDDVWMIGSLQIQAYRATGDELYLNRAAGEIVAYLDSLQRPNGLFHHGEMAPFFWGRGNGWVAAGLAEVLSELPKDHPHYHRILEGYRKMMYSLLKYQAEDGMWRQLIDVESSWKETSCTGMIGYAISVGVKKGILPEEEFQSACQKAWLALTGYITEGGKIREVCVSTGQSTHMDYYLSRPSVTGDLHGQAPVLWFAYSLLKE